jgi:hypothetical protein
MAQAYNYSFSGGWDQEDHSKGGQLNKNVHKTLSRPVGGLQDVATVETVATVTPATVETKNRKTVFQADLGKKWVPISKITKAKMARCMPHVVGYLSSKHKALISNPNTGKKNS